MRLAVPDRETIRGADHPSIFNQPWHRSMAVVSFGRVSRSCVSRIASLFADYRLPGGALRRRLAQHLQQILKRRESLRDAPSAISRVLRFAAPSFRPASLRAPFVVLSNFECFNRNAQSLPRPRTRPRKTRQRERSRCDRSFPFGRYDRALFTTLLPFCYQTPPRGAAVK